MQALSLLRPSRSFMPEDRLAEAGLEPYGGSAGDSDAMREAETINGLYKSEVVHRKAPLKSMDAVAYAPLIWVDGFNSRSCRLKLWPTPMQRSGKPLSLHDLNQIASGVTGTIQLYTWCAVCT